MRWHLFFTALMVSPLVFPHQVMAQRLLQEVSKVALRMGSRFEIMVVSADTALARKAIDVGYQEVDRIEQLISSWLANSQTSEINRMAGKTPVKVEKELFDLIYRSLKVSNLTDGAYDISFAGMSGFWQFNQQEITEMPDSAEVQKQAKRSNFRQIILNPKDTTVFLAESGMKIGFGSIGKGYAANRVMKLIKQLGVHSGMVNAGGDLITWGKDYQGKSWTMGIADPDSHEEMIAWLSLQDMALVTSGDYQKYFMYRQKRYGHIIDPRTGYPATGIKSVSIICPDAELADALATAVYVMGETEGMNLINQLKGIECLIITDDHRILPSDQLELNYYTLQD